MKRINCPYIVVILLIGLLHSASYAYAQSKSKISPTGKDRRTFALGSGGSNYSSLRKDRNGLYRSIYNGTHHFWGAWVDGAYSSFIFDSPALSITPGGEGLSAGLVYEFQQDIFRFQVGGGVRWQNVNSRVAFDTTVVNPNAIDSKGYPYTLRYDFYDRTDGAQTLYAVLPVSAGVGFYNFYCNIGLKMELPLSGKNTVQLSGTTTGTYDQFIGTFEEMDNHGFRYDVPVYIRHNGLALRNSLDLQVTAELGYEWAFNTGWVGGYNAKNKHFEQRLRIAAFAEYGLLNIVPDLSMPIFEIPDNEYKWDFPAFQFNHILTTDFADHHIANKFYAGIRVVVLIGHKTNSVCRLCNAYESEADM